MSELYHTSPSAVTLYDRCNRRAAFHYGFPELRPPYKTSAAQALGTRGHKILEDYHNHGKAPPNDKLGRLVLAMLKYWPKPKSGRAEGKFTFEENGLAYLGFMDLIVPGEIPHVYDAKFGNPQFGLQESIDFLSDPQGIIYAKYALKKFATKWVMLTWVKANTKTATPSVKPVSTLLDYGQVQENFEAKIVPAAERLVQIRRDRPDPNSIAFNEDACFDYNERCPFWDRCNRLDSVKETEGMDLLDEMMAAMGEKKEEPKPEPKPQSINPPTVAELEETTKAVAEPKPSVRVVSNSPVLVAIFEELGEAFTRIAKRI